MFLGKYAAFRVLPPGPFLSDARSIGISIFQSYVFPFEMVSILLLAAIVGALLMSGRAMGLRTKIGDEVRQ